MSRECLNGEVVQHSQLILNSYQRLLKIPLIERQDDLWLEAQLLFDAPFPVLTHNGQADPILNYGNQVALRLWEMDWDEFRKTPSRTTAEPINRAERERLLQQVRTQGYIDDYQGVRISKTGQRFFIPKAVVWNLIDNNGDYQGQAAIFKEYRYIK